MQASRQPHCKRMVHATEILLSGLYRLPCTSSVFVTAPLTEVRDLVVLHMLKQCRTVGGLFTMPCHFETAASYPWMCTSTTKDYIHCICTDSRLNMSGLCERASRWNYVSNCHLLPVVEKMHRLVSRLHHNPCCRWVHLLYMGTTKDATQYPLSVWDSSVSASSGMLV